MLGSYILSQIPPQYLPNQWESAFFQDVKPRIKSVLKDNISS
jgi:hypothetical protein